MSCKVGVLEERQPISGRPRREISRKQARTLIKRCRAKAIGPDLIQLLPEPVLSFRSVDFLPKLPTRYVPQNLPPAEVGGLVFDGPKPEHQSLCLARARMLSGGRARKLLAGSRVFVGYVAEASR